MLSAGFALVRDGTRVHLDDDEHGHLGLHGQRHAGADGPRGHLVGHADHGPVDAVDHRHVPLRDGLAKALEAHKLSFASVD